MNKATCSSCRREPAIYKVGGAVLGYRCIRRAKDKKVAHSFDDNLLPAVRKERARRRTLLGRRKKAA